MSAAWHWFVIALTLASIAGCLWLLFSQSRGKTGPETTHTWDDDLTEYNNPLPRWWLNLFVLTVVFALGYLVLFPGLGNITGRLDWSAQREMQIRLDQITARRQAQFASLASLSLPELSQHATARSLGRSVFVAHCAGCHGTDARGAIGFPDLTDADSLYGSTPDAVLASIEQGRSGQMPAFNGSLKPEQIDALLAFLPYWADPELDPARREAGLKAYAGTCAACHGADGRGNPAIGAPNLTDYVWLWGARREQIRDTLLFGRRNHMPSHADLLSPEERRVVAAYVLSLNAPAPAAESRASIVDPSPTP